MRIIGSVLSEEIGWLWPIFLIRALIRKRSVFDSTHWAEQKGVEAEFANRLCLSAAIYLGLVEKLGEDRAFEAMRRILVPIGCEERLDNVNSLGVADRRGMDRLWAFCDFMGQGGVGRFVERTIIGKSDDVLHYEVRGCFFDRLYGEVRMPDLTKLFCEVDTEFFAEGFPEFRFHRGDSLENTVAYGKDHCVFIFERRDSESVESANTGQAPDRIRAPRKPSVAHLPVARSGVGQECD